MTPQKIGTCRKQGLQKFCHLQACYAYQRYAQADINIPEYTVGGGSVRSLITTYGTLALS